MSSLNLSAYDGCPRSFSYAHRGLGSSDWKGCKQIGDDGPGEGDNRYRCGWEDPEWESTGSAFTEAFDAFSPSSFASRRVLCLLTVCERFDDRECHFSDGSPSRKLASAQRGVGFPRSSLTRLSSSAIRLRSLVASSNEGSSLRAGSSIS